MENKTGPNDRATRSAEVVTLIKNLQASMDANFIASDQKIDSLNQRISTQTDVWRSELNKVLQRQSIEMDDKISNLAEKILPRIDFLEKRNENFDRLSKLQEVIIRGIPYKENENLIRIFTNMSKSIKFPYENMYSLSTISKL